MVRTTINTRQMADCGNSSLHGRPTQIKCGGKSINTYRPKEKQQPLMASNILRYILLKGFAHFFLRAQNNNMSLLMETIYWLGCHTKYNNSYCLPVMTDHWGTVVSLWDNMLMDFAYWALMWSTRWNLRYIEEMCRRNILFYSSDTLI